MNIKRVDAVCMDCGREFVAEIDAETRRVLNAVYWGKIDVNMRYSWAYKYNDGIFERMEREPRWRNWIRDHVPGYCYEYKEPTVKSIWKRWYLLLMKAIHGRSEVELWTCAECDKKG